MPFNLGLESTRLESIKHMGGGRGMEGRGDGGGGGEKTAFQVGPHHTHEVRLLVLIQGAGAGEGGSGDLVQGLLVSSPVSFSSVALPE